jgi:hypothetical protein
MIGKRYIFYMRHHSDSLSKYSEADIKGMLCFFVHIRVVFANQDPYLQTFVDMNLEVNLNIAYIYLWGGTCQ